MKNADIVLNERINMMRRNALRTTDKMITIVENGTEVQINEPEELRSYWEWRNLGFQVPKGTKAKAYIDLWNLNRETGSWFKKSTPHFTRDQVISIEEANQQNTEENIPFGDFTKVEALYV